MDKKVVFWNCFMGILEGVNSMNGNKHKRFGKSLNLLRYYLDAYCSGLDFYFVVSTAVGVPHRFIVYARGVADKYVFVQELIRAAPPIKGVVLQAGVPQKYAIEDLLDGTDELHEFDGYSVRASELVFEITLICTEKLIADIIIYVPHCPADYDIVLLKEQVYTMTLELLGEEDLFRYINAVTVVPLVGAIPDLLPLYDLPLFISDSEWE